MKRSNSKKLPKFESLDELVEFCETHDLGQYWDQLPEVHFDVDIKRQIHLVEIDSDLAGKIDKLARAKHTSANTLIDSWLREKVSKETR